MLTIPADTASLGDWAQWYAAQGWAVFPCRGKIPWLPTAHPVGDSVRGICRGECGKPGHGYLDATSDPFQIAIWWRAMPTANIGMAMTDVLWALDVDPRNGGDNTLFALERQYHPLPHTLMSHTGGGGNHLLMTSPVPVQHHARIGDGLDVQAQGGYIILPPSIHPDTQRAYLWDIVDGPGDILPQPAPDWLVALVTAPAAAPAADTPLPDAPIAEGTRDDTLARMAVRMRRAGLSMDAIHEALIIENQRCVPPFTPAELERVLRGKDGYAPDPALVGVAPAEGHTNGTHHNGQPATPANTQAGPTVFGSTYKIPLTDFADMLERTYPLPQWIIQDLIPEGLTFFVGSPKSSKTYLAYSLALSLVSAMTLPDQVRWLGHYELSKQGPVVYVTLEDDEADTFYRVKELAPWLTDIPRDRLLFIHDINLPYLGAGLTEVIEAQIMKVYQPALIVLDPISYLYAPQRNSHDQFAQVKQMLLPLRWLGKQYHCGVLGVDHRRKKSADDVDIFETQYGSNAKVAVNDAQLVIVRDDKEITLHCQVRKARNQTISLELNFTPAGIAEWTWKGSADGMINQGVYGDLRMKILAALQAVQMPMSIGDLVTSCALPDSRDIRQSVDQVLRRGIRAGEVVKGVRRGEYVWAGGN